ncbi:HGGxSTG domain-containing protein [Sphingomonas sp. BE138]|uniref:HGGxSTG domain-containing protein n=1 Tax=Sphingomonas sp. BE138 TaxID=2817845 RepID=UPI0038680258
MFTSTKGGRPLSPTKSLSEDRGAGPPQSPINPMQPEPAVLANAPRCLARTRSGKECQSPAVRGKRRCRMHGGTNPGAPRGNSNALKHGLRTQEIKKLRALMADFVP